MKLARFNIVLTVVGLMMFSLISPHSVEATTPFPAFKMSAMPGTGESPLEVAFTFPGGGFNEGGSWKLDFGDGQSMSVIVPADYPYTLQKTHTYTSPGTYTAKVIDENNPDLEIPYANATITVSSGAVHSDPIPSSISLDASPSSGTAPLAISFTAPGPGVAGGYWKLHYGDGQSDFIAVPADMNTPTLRKTHIYTSPGTYTVRLVTDPANVEVGRTTVSVSSAENDPEESDSETDLKSSLIEITSINHSSGVAPLLVKATLGFSSTCQYYTLDWGDGSFEQKKRLSGTLDCGNSETSLKRSHTYTSPGTYTIRLQNNITDIEDDTAVIQVSGTSEEIDLSDFGEGSENEVRQQLISLIKQLLERLQSQGITMSVSNSSAGSGDTDTSGACVDIKNPLYLGASDNATNGDVSRLQNFLRTTGDLSYPEATGFYGQSTLQAVQKWQSRNGVVSTGTPASTGFGLVGALTRTALSCQ